MRRVIVVEGCINLLVVALKLVVGISTQSMAVLADAFHSLADAANNVLTWFVVRVAAKPPDANHPYGHRKFETIAVFALATLLAVMAVELVLHAARTTSQVVASEPWALALMVGVLVINIGLAAWQRYWAHRLDAEILHADASHTFGDVLTSVAVIAGWQFAAMGVWWLDRATALLVAGLVFYLAWGLYRRAIPILVDEASIDADVMSAAISDVAGVLAVGRARSRWTGSNPVADIVIYVDPDLSTRRAHEIADQVEHRLQEQLAIGDVTVHVEPMGDETVVETP